MNLTLITSVFSGVENQRLQEEATKLGHNLIILDPTTIDLEITSGQISLPQLDVTKPDILILRGVLYSVKKIVAIITYARSRGIKVFDNSLELMQYSINKTSDLIKLASAGVLVPDTRVGENYSLLPQMALDLNFPLVAKPIDTGKGIGVTMLHNQGEFDLFLTQKIASGTKAKRIMLQKFVPYLHDLRVLVIGNQTFCMERIPKEGDFRANFSLGGSVRLFTLDQANHELAIKALQSINMSIGGVDILITTGESYILEVNHSPGFEGMEAATGANIASIWLTHAISTAK